MKKLFRLKMFTLLETRITSKRFSVLFAFFEVFDRFSVLCYLAVLVMSAIFKWLFLGVLDNSCEKPVFLLNKFSVAIRSWKSLMSGFQWFLTVLHYLDVLHGRLLGSLVNFQTKQRCSWEALSTYETALSSSVLLSVFEVFDLISNCMLFGCIWCL